MRAVLASIKPFWADKIYSGEKDVTGRQGSYAVNNWTSMIGLKKYGRYPTFCCIENIAEYALCGEDV